MKWHIVADRRKRIAERNEIIDILLENRGIKTEKEVTEFLNPPNPSLLTPNRLGIDLQQLQKALKRIEAAIKSKEPVVIYGDYDVDGMCATAIIWECLTKLGAKTMPFIPQREKEGYGLSIEGIKNILGEEKYGLSKSVTGKKNKKSMGLIITVDNGIVANEAVDFAKENGLEVIILDHHEPSEKLPDAHAILHTEKLCGAGIAYFLAKEILNLVIARRETTKQSVTGKQIAALPLVARNDTNQWLELAAIATVADLAVLQGPNRAIVKYGLEVLNGTCRVGLRALFEVAGIKKVGTYEIGFLIAPRMNASGRIESALTALRLLCTKDAKYARQLAIELNEINKERQGMLEEMTMNAMEAQSEKRKTKNYDERIIVIEHESYHQGVIGLIAGKLVDKYYLPAIVISKGEKVSKASARSINGFNIIEAIRTCNDFLLNAGGHPMAAGFSIETERIYDLRIKIQEFAKQKITDEMLERTLRVDCELDLSVLNVDFYLQLLSLEPFGLGNPEPVFCSNVQVEQVKQVGQEGKHLKMVVGGVHETPGPINKRAPHDGPPPAPF